MEPQINPFITKLTNLNLNKIFLGVLAVSVLTGITAGYLLSQGSRSATQETAPLTENAPKIPQQDNKTFRDFAQGVLQKRPTPKNNEGYIEGTHLLIREAAVPVALTSSVVDLNQYEGKKIKVFGETQKALKEGWLMDVGKVEVE